jgi:TRAP-type C4-dicarboxylate transport system permease small subunit
MVNDELRESILYHLKITAEAAGFSEPASPVEIIAALIGVFLSFLGIIFLILIIYGGFVWMTSGGNETKVLKAKKILERAVVGLIIIMASYGITVFVFNSLQAAV